MKKTLLSIALLSTSLSSLAGELHGSLSGMSDAAYATGNYSEGVLLNPSLGAAYNPDKDDFALLIGAGALVSDKNEMLDQADELSNLLDDIDQSQTISKAQAQDLLSRLEAISGDTALVTAGANLVLSIPNELVSVALIASSQASVSVTPLITDEDLALVESYLADDAQFNDFDSSELSSSVLGRGAVVSDLGVAFSKAFALADGTHLLVGVKPKKTEVESIIYTASVADFDEDDFDAEDYTYTDSAANVDLGVTYIRGNLRYGLVANNLQSHSYKTIDPTQTITIERQLISSVGYTNGAFKAEAALDLNAVAAIGLAGETQLLRAGVEYGLWDLLRLRAGIQQEMKEALEDTYSLGLGVGTFNLSYIAGSKNTQGVALSGGFRF
jgi:hypothetical protein